MKKFNYLCGAAFACAALFMVSCSVKDDPIVDNRISDVKGFVEAVEAAEDGGSVRLASNADIVLTEPLKIDKKLTITGDAGAPAYITLADGGIETANSLTLEYVKLDCSANTQPVVSLAAEPTAELLNETDYYGIENITLRGVTVAFAKNSLIYDNNKKYCVVNLTIDDCILNFITEEVKNEALIAFQAGGVKDFTIKNTTAYGNNAVAKYFIRYNNNSRIDRYGFTDAADTWSFTYENNTFVNLLKEDGQWGNYNGVAGKAGLMILTINNNIWVDCDKETMRRLNHSKSFTNFNEASTMQNNTFWREGAAQDQKAYGNGTDLTTDPALQDFVPTGADQVANKTGDPRWFK